jgi:hypothetical protein
LNDDCFRVGSGGGFRLEWYAEAEFGDDNVLSFGQEAAWHDGEWIMDASVRRNGAGGEDILFELPRRSAITSEDVVADLREQSRMLVDRWEETLRLEPPP